MHICSLTCYDCFGLIFLQWIRVIQTTGLCNFGKLNYYLGAGAQRDGRDAKYPNIDFCKTPDKICSSEENPELKWIAGFFYWMQVSHQATLRRYPICCLNACIYIKTRDVLLILPHFWRIVLQDVQSYNKDGWYYMTELHKFVNNGMVDISFIDAISGIVNRGCHNARK